MGEKWFLNVMMLSQPHLANCWELRHHLWKKFDEFNAKRISEKTFSVPFFFLFLQTSQLEQVLHPAQPIILCYVTVA